MVNTKTNQANTHEKCKMFMRMKTDGIASLESAVSDNTLC